MPQNPPAADATVLQPAEVHSVAKPWGRELWLARTDRYAGKVLELNKGHRLSLQYHERKHEVQYLDSGRVRYSLGSADKPDDLREVVAEAGAVIILPPGAIHRMEALEDSRIFEISTPELEDVVRIEDDYGRAGTNAP
jgi:mannose-6-phosphate isomerase-like protein (cupin superfamily)